MSRSIDRSRAPEPAPLRPFHFPEFDQFELENGVPVFFCRVDRLPVCTLSLYLPGGALREQPAEAGLATLTSSLLESGTATLDAGDIAERLETLGVRLHAGASWEATNVDFTALSDRIDEAIRLTSHLVSDSTFPEHEVERIRAEQLAAILQRRAEPRGLANEMVARYIFAPESPFARPISGTTGTVGSLARGSAVEFHRSTYTPSGAGLIVVGDATVDQVRRLAEVSIGWWRGGPAPERVPTIRPRREAVQMVIVDRPGAVQSEIRIGHVGVPRSTPDYFGIVVMNTILGGAFSSRLNLNLRERQGYTYGVSSSFVMRRQPGPFLVSTAVQTEVTGPAVREILNEIERMRQETVEDEELTDARNYVAGTYPLRLQTTDGVASRLAELFLYDLPRSYVDEFAARILAVDAGEVLQAARKHLQPDRATILVVGDAARVRPQLEELDLGEVEISTPMNDS